MLWYVVFQNCSINIGCTLRSRLACESHTQWFVLSTKPILAWCFSLLILWIHQALPFWLCFMLMPHLLDKAWPITPSTVCYYWHYINYCDYITYICFDSVFVEFAWRRAFETQKLGASGLDSCLRWKQGFTARYRFWFYISSKVSVVPRLLDWISG